MESCDIADQIVKAVARDAARAVEVDAAEALHDLRVVRDLEIGNERLAEALDFDVLAVVLPYRYGRVDYVRDRHHYLSDALRELLFLLFESGESGGLLADLALRLLGLLALALRHQAADHLRDLVAVRAQLVRFLHYGAVRLVQRDDLVDERKLVVLELLSDILLYRFRVFPYESDIKHF